MRRLLPLAVLLVAAPLAALPPAAAQEATPAAGAAPAALLAPGAEVAGAGLPEWSGRFYQWLLSFPEAASPLFDETGERCAVGQHGPVFFLAPLPTQAPGTELACTVPAGAALFVPHVATNCSTAEAPPFFGRDEAELRACAAAAVGGLLPPGGVPVLVVDGVEASLAPYRVQTPVVRVALPAGNILGGPAGAADVVAEGYHALLAPLPPGEHELRWGYRDEDGRVGGETAYALTVAEPVAAEPGGGAGATPAA
jgi:hypothetical protein